MGKLSEVAGIGPIFTRDDQERQCSAVQPYHRALFESWLVKQAWQEIERAKQFVSADTTAISISTLLLDLAAKKYSQGSATYRDASRSSEGIRYLLLVMLRDHDKSITEEWVAKWTEEKPDEAVRVYNEATSSASVNEPKDDEEGEGQESDDTKS